MQDNSLKVKSIMYGFSMEKWSSEGEWKPTIKVSIPELFPDAPNGEPVNGDIMDTGKVFVNKIPIAVETIKTQNYLEIPHNIPYKKDWLTKGQRLVISFIHENPKNGFILGKG